jgi:aminoglycoside phosphotransferase (APT) family kinase protein
MSDTISVRPDEVLDEARLAEYLSGRLPGSEAPLSVRQFGGGAANLTYLLDYGGREYVLRRPPLGPLAPGAHDMSREYRVLSVLHAAFAPAPEALLFCDDPAIIGAPFFVMERRVGEVVRRSLPPLFDTPDAPRQMSLALVDALADLHAVDFHALGLTTLGKPEGFIARQIEGWYDRWNRAKLGEVAAMDNVHAWLRDHQPPPSPPALVHNDFKLDNVMFDPADPAHLVAVFDWDMSTIGEPLADLGTLLCYWSHPDDPPAFQLMAMMPIDRRFPTRAELVGRYAERSGRDVSAINYYHVLGLYRLTVIIAQIYVRYHRGQTKDERFAAFGPMIEIAAAAAEELTKQ